ncbi:MAG: DinB family protein [Balneolaceae bacterium]
MYIDMWKMGRTRLTHQLENIDKADLLKRVHPDSSSVGWLLRHIAEVELLFAKNVYRQEISVKAQTIGPIGKDRGQFKELDPLLELVRQSGDALGMAIESVDDWGQTVTTAEFGTVTNAQALGRILSHTAYHSGQVALAVKYGE